MELREHIAQLRRDGDLLTAVAATTALDTKVPTCPQWDVRELVHHQGRVHRWAATYVRDGRVTPMDDAESEAAWGPMPPDDELTSWFAAGHGALLDALVAAPDDLDCFSFLPARSPRAFWVRRQAHETAIHRADGQAAAGAIDAFPTAFAVDGIDELLLGFFGRSDDRLVMQVPRRLQLTATDTGDQWTVTIGPQGVRTDKLGGDADASLAASASDLYLVMWNRLDPDLVGHEGDPSVMKLWRANARIRWS